jgi:hypothetical protein
VLPPEFWTTTENVSGVNARLIEFSGTRRTARVVPYGAPAKQAEKVSLSDRGIILLSSREEMAFRDELLKILREWEDYKPQQAFAMKEIAHQGEQDAAAVREPGDRRGRRRRSPTPACATSTARATSCRAPRAPS